MQAADIFWPVLAQVVLTVSMFIVLAARRARAMKANEVNREAAALDPRVWPADVIKVSNNISNQFETPVLFYILCMILYQVEGVGMISMVLAWVFVGSRYVHAFVQTGSNHVPLRMNVFLLSCAVLIALTAITGISLSTGMAF